MNDSLETSEAEAREVAPGVFDLPGLEPNSSQQSRVEANGEGASASSPAPSITTGPWRARRWTCHAATSVTVFDPNSVTGARIVAECETEADARLIAAAPDMLAALEGLLKMGVKSSWPAWEAALNAVAKARGLES